jgi:hypothetical protein
MPHEFVFDAVVRIGTVAVVVRQAYEQEADNVV